MINNPKEIINKLRERAKSSLSIKNVILTILISIIILSVFALTILIVNRLLSYIFANFEILFITIGSFVCLIVWIKERAKDRREQKITSDNNILQQEEAIEKARADENYKLIRQCLYLVNNDLCSITHLHKIGSLSEMDTPNHYVVKNGFYLYQYLIAKETANVDMSNLKTILSRRLEQRIMAQEFSGITQTLYVHSSGRSYPILCIDTIIDMGAYIQIDIAWSGKLYCEYLEGKESSKIQLKQFANPNNRDKDF